MDSVLRAVVIYFILLVVFRIAGRRTLSEITNFDFVLLLIISEATQNAMIGEDYSIMNAVLVIVTLIALDIGLSLWKQRSHRLDRWLEGLPTVIVADGRPMRDLMVQARIDEEDILAAARELQGLERMDQIKYAVLERSGGISIIPKPGAKG
ncbi:MAG: DUF421 domain-containing protein [Isosphaeraceae bacterium]|nr:DUF421 domain-containing protein [Isosphaeraceae bacterium]